MTTQWSGPERRKDSRILETALSDIKTELVRINQFIENLSPELKSAVLNIAETIKPALNEIHAQKPTTKNYYGDYMRLLSYRPKYAKILALAMLYEGANPDGVQAAVKLV